MNRKAVWIPTVLVIAAAIVFYVSSRGTLDSAAYLPPGKPTAALRSNSSGDPYDRYGYGAVDPSRITFSDTAESNAETQVPLGELTLVNEDLQQVTLSELQGDQNLLLVVIRGAPLCPFCTAQTSRLVSNYQKFKDLGAEVVVVFPGTQDDLKQLLMKASLDGQHLPFPILVDTELDTVRRLDIEGDKAMPSTFIIDHGGRTQFAYIGANISDRPSIQALLTALERISPSEPEGTDAATEAPEGNSEQGS